MCGIAGIFGQRSISRQALARIAGFVRHRGPDHTGLRLYLGDFTPAQDAGPFAMFHNRLSILDLDARSHQPFEDERYSLVFNGEIYDFQSLRSELRQLGHVFRTQSDTEVLFAALKQWGAAALPRLNGMFAFAFIDRQARTVLLARDRVGIKPLYYAWMNGAFSFASEADTIIRLNGVIPAIDLTAADHYRLFQYVPGSRSIWSGIHKLLPGHVLELTLDDPAGYRVRQYWDAYEAARTARPSQDWEALVSQAVTRQLVADVPVGVFLSSGVDSSLLAAIIQKHNPDAKVGYFTVGFDDAPENDESVKAARFLDGLGVPRSSLTRLPLTSDAVRDLWQDLYQVVDEPFGDHAILLNLAIAREAAKHVTVVLSGDGGDEVFAGYDRYRAWHDHQRWRWMGLAAAWPMRLAGRWSGSRTLAVRGERDPVLQYLMLLTPGDDSVTKLRSILRQCDFANGLGGLADRRDLPRLIDMKSYLPDGMLFKVDRASMAASVEVRVPLLDNELIDAGLAEDLMQSGRPLKWPLREILKRLAPHYDLEAPKKGFSFPLQDWMRRKWSGLIQEIVHDGDRHSLGIADATILRDLESFRAGDNHVGYRLWIEANLLLWHRHKLGQLGGTVRI